MEDIFTRLSETSKADIIDTYSRQFELICDYKFYHDGSDTLFGLVYDGKNCFWAIRIEGNRHKATRGMIRFAIKTMRDISALTGRKIRVKTARIFYKDKAKKLLKLCKFEFEKEENGFIISVFKE
jgi:hypothetical protein